MASRGSSRTYGSVDSASALLDETRPHKVRGDDADFSMPPPLHLPMAVPAAGQRSTTASRTKSWVTVALICAAGIGTIAATHRSNFTRERLSPHDDAGSLAALQPSASTSRDDTPTMARVEQHQRKEEHVGLSGDPPALDYSATNFYHERDGRPGAQIPWLADVKFAEPFRDTTLKVDSPRQGYVYAWTISNSETKDGSKDIVATAQGAEVVMQFTRLDTNGVRLQEIDEVTRETVREMQDTIMVKYVRREIRTLTEEDREELLDGMLKLWTVRMDTGEGKELYGEDYADIWAINRLHFKAASHYECDHFHDGLGFLTSHALITNTFEYSLQRVNPKLTVPYWDFTIETSSSFVKSAKDSTEPQASSPLFDPAWFGTSDHDDNMVKDGRWGYTEIPRMKFGNPGSIDADIYGKLRAPWNVNHRPYLTRGMGSICGVRAEPKYSWPTCELHYDLTIDYTDFYSWVWTSLYSPHGPVHVWLGGVLDCSETYAKLTKLVGPYISKNLAYYSFVHRKNLYRSGLWSCEGVAGVDATPAEILKSETCGCLDYDLTQGDDYMLIKGEIVWLDSYIGDFDADTQREVVATICNGVMNDGDHLQASSSLDPTFWVTHPTMERLWMFKRLTGTMTDLSWPDADVAYVDDTTGETVVESLSLYSEDCLGHRGKDVFPFGLASDEDNDNDFQIRTGIRGDNDSGNTLNNREILRLLDPRVNSLNYIYDTFEWKHCMDDGINFNDAFGDGESEGDGADRTGEDRTGKTSKDEEKKTGSGIRPTFRQGGPKYPRYKVMEEEFKKWATTRGNNQQA